MKYERSRKNQQCIVLLFAWNSLQKKKYSLTFMSLISSHDDNIKPILKFTAGCRTHDLTF